MKSTIGKAAFAAVLALGAAGAASAGVTVNYVQSDKFTDLPFTTWERDDVLRILTEHFAKLGKELPAGQELAVDVTDIDLAGREYPSRRAGGDIRVLQGMADWPRIELNYTLSANGQVIDSGKARLSDMSYLQRPVRGFDNDALRYEKRMLDEWFDKAILHKKPG
jgi:hypothetical protein